MIQSEEELIERMIMYLDTYHQSKGKEKEKAGEMILQLAEEVINTPAIRSQIDGKLLGLLETMVDQLSQAIEDGEAYPDLTGIKAELA